MKLEEYGMTIKEFHLDTFGHVNNSVYLEIFEEARWEVITKNGYGLAEVQKRQQGPVILKVQLEFLKELKLRENIKILTSTDPFNGKISMIYQDIYNQKEELCCKAVFTYGFFDLRARKLIEPSPEWLKAMGTPPHRVLIES